MNADIKSTWVKWMKKEIMEQPETIQKVHNYGGRLLDGFVKLGGLDRLKINFETFEGSIPPTSTSSFMFFHYLLFLELGVRHSTIQCLYDCWRVRRC